MSRRRRDRIFLPGWWKFWEPGPQWSATARQRLGVPAPSPPSDWSLWESELRPVPGHLGSATGTDTLTGVDLTATFDATGPGPAGRPSAVDDLTDELAARRRARDAKDKSTNGGEGA